MIRLSTRLSNALFLFLTFILVSSAQARSIGQVTNVHTRKPDFCIVVEEEDQDPSNVYCKPLRVTNGSLTDNGTYFSLSITGSGDSVSIDSGAVTDPDFVSTGDIDFVDTSNTVTANINAGAVQDDEVDYTAVTLNDFTFDVNSTTKTEFGYLNGVTSAIQTQLDAKLPLAGGTLTGELTADELGLEFQKTDGLTDCSTFSATGGGIFYDDSEGKFKKCQDNTLTDLDTGGAETNSLEADGAVGIADTEVFIGTGAGAGTGNYAALSGDVTMTNGGVTTIGALKLDAGMYSADSIDDDDISNSADVMSGSFGITIDGGGSAISTGIKGDIEVPYAMTIDQSTFLCDQSGSIVVDLWVDSYANFPPTDADSITASAPPTITTATKSQDPTLTGWTTSITAGQIVRFNVDSASTVTRCTLIISGNKL